MSKQVWKCDYCYETEADKEEMDKHELTCSENENSKKCSTCKHYVECGYPIGGSDMRCTNKKAEDTYGENMSYFFDEYTKEEEENFYPCRYWESDKCGE